MVEIWFILVLILLFIELITVNLVTIWFVIGSLAAMITTLITDNVTIQVIVFIVVSLISLIATKPFIKKMRTRKIIPTNLDRVIGKTGIVTKEITKNSYGEVKVEGSVKLVVEKIKEEKE